MVYTQTIAFTVSKLKRQVHWLDNFNEFRQVDMHGTQRLFQFLKGFFFGLFRFCFSSDFHVITANVPKMTCICAAFQIIIITLTVVTVYAYHTILHLSVFIITPNSVLRYVQYVWTYLITVPALFLKGIKSSLFFSTSSKLNVVLGPRRALGIP